MLRYHFSGIGGAGMNPLARLMRARGHDVQGSDRAFDGGKSADLAAQLRALGIRLLLQDGSAITPGLEMAVGEFMVGLGKGWYAGGIASWATTEVTRQDDAMI
jgi:UDP-N-acetylmuramate--alanine ligase